MKPVRGTRDLLRKSYDRYQYFAQVYREHMRLYGFQGVETPVLEHLELFGSELGATSDIVSKELYVTGPLSNQKTEYDTVLRPEGTVSCIRAAVSEGCIDDSFLRLYYYGAMFRYNRPQKGRFRQFNQFGCEVLNANDGSTDFEMIECLIKLLAKVGITPKLHINTLGSGLTKYRDELKKFFERKADLLSDMNKARLGTNVMRVLDQLSDAEKAALGNDMPNILDHISDEDRARFAQVCKMLDQAKISYTIDPYLVRGLDYYKHTVYELALDTLSIAGGGAYSMNRARFGAGSADVFGAGWAIGYERIEDLISVPAKIGLSALVNGKDPEHVNTISEYLRWKNIVAFPIYRSEKNANKRAQQLGADYIIDAADYPTLRVRSFDKEFVCNLSDLPSLITAQ